MTTIPQFFGKYRGTVINNIDPLQSGRVQVSVPDVLGQDLAWAMPCVPFTRKGTLARGIPSNGANVWVEFEAGDPDRPIWTGGF